MYILNWSQAKQAFRYHQLCSAFVQVGGRSSALHLSGAEERGRKGPGGAGEGAGDTNGLHGGYDHNVVLGDGAVVVTFAQVVSNVAAGQLIIRWACTPLTAGSLGWPPVCISLMQC